MRAGLLSTFYHTATLLLGRDDLPAALGAEINWQLFPTGPAIVEAFARGELDLAYIGLPPAIIGMQQGVDIKCIAGGHIEGTVIVGARGCKAYPKEAGTLEEVLAQFKGHRVGVPGKGSIHDVILKDCLGSFGLKRDVRVTNFKWADEITESMARGEIHGAFGTPALGVAVSRYAGGRLLAPAGMLWPWNPSYGIVARGSFIREQRETALRFLALHEEASEALRLRPGEAARKIAHVVGVVDEEFVLDTLKISPRYCAQLTPQYIGCTMDFARAMKGLGYIDDVMTEDRIFDQSLIERVHPPGDHYEAAE